MRLSTRLQQRHREPEIMDQPGLDEGRHHQALEGIARINWVSASSLILWPPIRALCRRRLAAGDSRPVRVLDVATGGGDVPIRMWRRARRQGLPLEVAGCDCNPIAVDHAQRRAVEHRAKADFFPLDVLTDTLPGGYDVITCSLFLHHLEEDQAVILLQKMLDAAGRLALVNDLLRSPAGWLLAYVGTRLLTRSAMVHTDGLISVEAAFTMSEATELARRAGWEGATIHWRWPFRFLLQWSRP
jgi:2-polyprenyl-3-methyl-5-hydroxy-6-metoxy-1,4-benzoquinol methylase